MKGWRGAVAVVLGIGAAAFVFFWHAKRAGRRSSGATWTAYGGSWTSNGAQIDNTSEERGAKYIVSSQIDQDYVVDADLRIAEQDGEAGLILRSSGEESGVDSYHGYFAGVRTTDATLEFGRADFGWTPLMRIALPAQADPRREFHMRAVAVGCAFGVEVTWADGQKSSLATEDADCIHAGHTGLRSVLTSAIWRHVAIHPAVPEDLNRIREEARGAQPLPLRATFAAVHTAQYESSLRAEARKRAIQPGVQTIVSFLMQPGRHPDVTLQGTIISLPPLVAIQDDTNALIVPGVDPHTPIKLGDVVTVHGTVVSDRFRSVLEGADIRVLWSDLPIPPLFVTAAQLTGGTYRGRFIEIEGTLVSCAEHGNVQEVVLRDGDLLFRGVGTPNYRMDVAHFEPGSRIRLRGLATSLDEFTSGTYPFAVLVDQADIVSAPPWWSPRHIALVALVFALFALGVQFAFHRIRQWQLESVIKEREQLAFEMHDTLAQSFTGIAYQLNAARIERRGLDEVQSHIKHALEMVQFSHKEASQTIAALRPQLRDAAAMLGALEQQARRLADGGPLRIETRMSGRLIALPVQVSDSLFRIGQEAISNAVQHGKCNALEIELGIHKREVRLSIRDNGVGFDPAAARAGLGLAGMRSRAEKVRGRLEVSTAPGQGAAVTVRAPLPMAGGLMRTLSGMLRRPAGRQARDPDFSD